jgi:hypothetical protein
VTIENGGQTIIGRAKVFEGLSEGWKVLLPYFELIDFSCEFEVYKINSRMLEITNSVGG